ncbi:MAG TPA: DUF2807 domain-containing protein [Bacteroidia bacterium]|jgi:hypothetical protein|nr:DUF2807 domain-containing protein [Bacteroidia bacterium]
MNKIFKNSIVFFTFLMCIYSCQKIKQPPASQTPLPSDFKNISINGTVNISLSAGSANEVADVSSSNVEMTIIKNTLNVSGYGTLSLRINKCDTIFVNANSIVNSSVPDFKHIVFMCNTGSISANDIAASDSINVNSNNLFINSISGATKKLILNMNSTALFAGYGLNSKNAIVNVNNSGDAQVTVTDTLRATINGSGDIYYKGNPAMVIPVFVSGKGQIIPK